MIVRRTWSNDLYAFLSAVEMSKMGIRIISIFVNPEDERWEVWGQHEGDLDYDELDRRTDRALYPDDDT